MDNLNDLPTEIIWDIFTRLPTESVPACKSISKTWRNLIQHPSFFQTHFNRLNHHSIDSCKLSFFALATNQQLYYIEYNDQTTPNIKIIRMNLKTPFRNNDTLVGSINGLICLHCWNIGFCICNPMTKEYVILPEPTNNFGYGFGFGFGYLPSTNEYKVVALCKLSTIEVMVMVYTLGSGNNGWRGVGRFIYAGQCDINQRLGVFVNGALYWVHDRKEIFVFYLAKERFFVQPPPPASPQGGYRKADKIGVLGGFLFQRYSDSDDAPESHDIWLYKKKNDNNYNMKQEDWTKEFKLPAEEVLDFTKSGGILTYSSNNLNLYDPKTSTWKTLAFFREGFRRVFPHKNTLLSLEQLGEEDTEIMKSG